MEKGVDTIRNRFALLDGIRTYYLEHPGGVGDVELGEVFNLTRRMASKYRVALGCTKVQKYPALYTWQADDGLKRFAALALK